MSTTNLALERYDLLIEELAEEVERNFGGIGDPLFESVRFYTCDRVDGSFSHNRVTELAAEKVNEIEGLLMQTEEAVPLFAPLLTKLKTIAPEFNKNGQFVFLGSWGMGPGEIGWCIRYLNDRSIFERYLAAAGISEADVDLYNDAFAEDLNAQA